MTPVSRPDAAVAKFDARAATYEHSVLQPLLYIPAQQRVLQLAQRLMPQPRRVLDIGCGSGRLLRQARQQYPMAALVGVDLAWGMVATATATAPAELAIRHIHAAAERLPFAGRVFDLVVATMSLRHWTNLTAGIAEIDRVLAPGGVLIVADLFPTCRRQSFPLVVLQRRSRHHGGAPAELAAVLAPHRLVMVGCEHMPWVGLPDIHVMAAQKPLCPHLDPPTQQP